MHHHHQTRLHSLVGLDLDILFLILTKWRTLQGGRGPTLPPFVPPVGAQAGWLCVLLLATPADASLRALEPRPDCCCLAVLHGVLSESCRGRKVRKFWTTKKRIVFFDD